MRILFVALEYPPLTGGGASYLETLVQALRAHAPEHQLAIVTSGAEDKDETDAAGVRIYRRESCQMSLKETTLAARLIDDIMKAVTDFKPEVVHAHHSVPILAVETIAKAWPIRAVYTQHRTPELPSAPVKFDGKGAIAELTYAETSGGSWVAPSNFFKRKLVKSGIPASSISVVWPSINEQLFNYVEPVEARRKMHKLLGIDESTKVITIPAVNRPRKDIRFCLEVVSRLGDGHAILVTGMNQGEDGHKDLSREFPGVLVDHDYIARNDMPSVMAGSDAVVMCATHEGFGISAIEALATGANVHLRRSPGLDEIIAAEPSAVAFATQDELMANLKATLAEKRDPSDVKKQSQSTLKTFSGKERAEKHVAEYVVAADTVLSTGGVCLWHSKDGWQVRLVHNGRGEYHLPKGHVKDGETWEAAARREITEETGLTTGDLGFYLDELRYPVQLAEDKTVNKRVKFFVLVQESDFAGAPKPDEGEDISGSEWFEVNDANLGKMKFLSEAQLVRRAVDRVDGYV